MKHWLVCQTCGAVKQMEAARQDGWFVSPHRLVPDTFVVRCYRHITVRAMMASIDGRSKENFELMHKGRERAASEPPYNPLIEPFPMTDRPPT